ncbi:MAG: GntG family PLP-dependent aldolase [Planctomycetota bacterium]
MDPGEVRAAIRPDFIHCPRTALICMEQTHNMAGGRVLGWDEVQAVVAVAQEAGIPMHLDGARLANAVVASGIAARDWAGPFCSVSLCLSKGLGAPVGSVIAGDREFLERARLWRKRLGGWMRQAGHLAAAARIALHEGPAHLVADHALARQIAERLQGLPGLQIDLAAVQSNMVMVGLPEPLPPAAECSAALARHGVRIAPMGARRLRIVTHRDVGPADADRLVAAFQDLVRA